MLYNIVYRGSSFVIRELMVISTITKYKKTKQNTFERDFRMNI